MLIGELSEKAGVGKHTIRHYEDLGLIYSDERIAGSRVYREYSDETVSRLYLIQMGKKVGLTLKRMKPLLDSFLDGSLSVEQQMAVLEQQHSEVGVKIRELEAMKQLIGEKIDILKRKQSGESVSCQANGE